jgi:cytochrome P450
LDLCIVEKQLLAVCRNLFAAGTDTTFNSVTFALVYMVRFPEIQEKVQEEIDRVVGRDRLPSLEDRARYIIITFSYNFYTHFSKHMVLRIQSFSLHKIFEMKYIII